MHTSPISIPVRPTRKAGPIFIVKRSRTPSMNHNELPAAIPVRTTRTAGPIFLVKRGRA